MYDPKKIQNKDERGKELTDRLFGKPAAMSVLEQAVFRENYGLPREVVYDPQTHSFGLPGSSFAISPGVIADLGSWAAAYGKIVMVDQEPAS